MDKILIDHGSGGLLSQELIQGLFLKYLPTQRILGLEDCAIIPGRQGKLAFSTDSYVVDPIFFPGGDIGRLAVNGTINDLSMRGAIPFCMSLSLILEEGFPMADLERVIESVAHASDEAGVPVVTGDTKVVPRQKADKIFINTTGMGVVPDHVEISGASARAGDVIIISGSVADHGVTIMGSRAGLSLGGELESDTAALNRMVEGLVSRLPGTVHAMRDPTRGGVATALTEIAQASGVAMEVDEAKIPVKPGIKAACELLGLDPLYLANEGKCIVIAASDQVAAVLETIRSMPEGKDATVIGEVISGPAGRVTLRTRAGGARLIVPLEGEPLPRIC